MKRAEENYSPSFTILTNDPSLTAWGWAVIRNGNVMATGCIRTKTEGKMRKIRKGDENCRRIHEINMELKSVIKKYHVNFLLSELPGGSQDATAAAALSFCIGILQTTADVMNIPIEWYAESDTKMCLLGIKTIKKKKGEPADKGKAMMLEAIKKLHRKDLNDIFVGFKYYDYAVADALAVYHTALKQSNIIRK